MITKGEQQQIKSLLQTPQWQVAEMIANKFRDKLAYDSPVRETEWDTIKTTLIKEGQIQGIKIFIEELYKIALNDQDGTHNTTK